MLQAVAILQKSIFVALRKTQSQVSQKPFFHDHFHIDVLL